MRHLACGLALALALVAAGCAQPTEVIVVLSAPSEVAVDARHLDVQVIDQMGQVVRDLTPPLDVTGRGPVMARVPVVPVGGDASRVFTVRAQLFGELDAVIGRVEAVVGFRANLITEVRLVFDAACRDVPDCGPGRTCVDGLCVGACFDASPLGTPHGPPLCTACERCTLGTCEPLGDGSTCTPACFGATTFCGDEPGRCCTGLVCGTSTAGNVCCGLARAPCATEEGEDCCGSLLCGMTSEGTQRCCGDVGEVCATELGEDCCGNLACIDHRCQ